MKKVNTRATFLLISIMKVSDHVRLCLAVSLRVWVSSYV